MKSFEAISKKVVNMFKKQGTQGKNKKRKFCEKKLNVFMKNKKEIGFMAVTVCSILQPKMKKVDK